MAKNTKIVSGDKVYVNDTKYKRAEGILALLQGKPATPHLKSEYSQEGQQSLVVRFSELLKAEDLNPKDAGALDFIYKTLGGAILTKEKQAKLKNAAAKAKSKATKKDEGEEDAEDAEDGESEDETTDEDEE